MDVERPNAQRVGRPADLRREAAMRSYGMLAGLAPGRCLSDELIAERRQDARREDAAETAPLTRRE